MSGSDIRDILQIGPATEPIQKKSKAPAEKRPGKKKMKKKKKVYCIDSKRVEGISRELFSLIGGAPPVAFVKPTFKSKFKTKKKVTPW